MEAELEFIKRHRCQALGLKELEVVGRKDIPKDEGVGSPKTVSCSQVLFDSLPPNGRVALNIYIFDDFEERSTLAR